MTSRLIVALDTPDLPTAQAWATAVAPHCALLKIGLELFCAQGPAALSAFPLPIFLDLKLHDVPNTVAGAVRALAPRHPRMLTLHAAAPAMIEAARAADQAVTLLAVTVLTSLNAATLATLGTIGTPADQVLRLARIALAAGADGLICSGEEVAMLRQTFGAKPILVVPGIRRAGDSAADQQRTTTPRAAIAAGASYIVVGRPITGAKNPAAAAAAIAAEIA